MEASSNLMVLNLGCILEFPAELFNVLLPGAHLKTLIKMEWVWPEDEDFFVPLLSLSNIQLRMQSNGKVCVRVPEIVRDSAFQQVVIYLS